MNYGEGALSASDVALLSGNTGRNNDGFGDGSGWWIIVFLIFALGGWGRNGFGGGFGGGNSGGVADNYVLATDFATIERKLDGVNNGLCDGFYAVSQQFSNTNQNISILVRHDYPLDTLCSKPVNKTSLKCGNNIYCIVDEISEYTYIYGTGKTNSFY